MQAQQNTGGRIRLQVGGIVHRLSSVPVHLVEDDGGDWQVSARHRLQRHQGLVDRADTVVDNDNHRELQRAGQVGIQAVFRERRVKTTRAFDDQAMIAVVALQASTSACSSDTPSSRRAARCGASAAR